MRGNLKQILCLIMIFAVCMVSFTGCGASTNDANSAESQVNMEDNAVAESSGESTLAQPETVSQEPAEMQEESDAVSSEEAEIASDIETEPAEPDHGFFPVSMPLVDEPVTLSVFKPLVPYLAGGNVAEFSDWAFFKYIEQEGNITFEFLSCDTSSAYNNTNLIIASGEMPDFMSNLNQNYTAGLDSAIEEGLIFDLAEYPDQIPNYLASLRLNDNFLRLCYSKSGSLGAAYRLDVETEGVTNGMVLRGDLVEAVGMDIPETYDDYDKLFAAWHDQLGMDGFLAITKYGIEKALSAGFETVGAGDNPFYVKDKVVQFGPNNEGYRECLELMRDWYAAGYINDQFVNWTTFSISPDVMLTENIACTVGTPPQIAVIVQDALQESDPNASIVPASFPTKEPGQLTHMRRSEEYIGESISVTTSTEDLDACLAYIDYLYSEEGTQIANYGEEGVAFEYDENGDPQLTDLVVNNPDGIGLSAALCMYTRYSGPFRNYASRYTSSYEPLIQKCSDVWTNQDDDIYNLPNAMDTTAEQSSEYNGIWSDMSTYILEWSNRVIVGTNELNDTTWQEYLNTLESMNVNRLIELEQEIYDSYLEKDKLLGLE